MADAVHTTKGEFDRFWDDVLGDDWYIHEWDVDDTHWGSDVPDALPLTISLLDIDWQGRGDPKPTSWITAVDIADGDRGVPGGLGLVLLQRWLAVNARDSVRYVVTVPSDRVAAFVEWVDANGAHTVPAEVTGG